MHLIDTFLYHADVGWFKEKYFQESLSGPFTNAKTQELPGALPPGPPTGLCPWTPPGALEGVPGPHAVRRSSRFARYVFMDSKLLALTRRTNTKFVPTGLIEWQRCSVKIRVLTALHARHLQMGVPPPPGPRAKNVWTFQNFKTRLRGIPTALRCTVHWVMVREHAGKRGFPKMAAEFPGSACCSHR